MIEMGMRWHQEARGVLFWPVIIAHRADRVRMWCIKNIARLNIHLQILSLGMLDYGFVKLIIKSLNGY